MSFIFLVCVSALNVYKFVADCEHFVWFPQMRANKKKQGKTDEHATTVYCVDAVTVVAICYYYRIVTL